MYAASHLQSSSSSSTAPISATDLLTDLGAPASTSSAAADANAPSTAALDAIVAIGTLIKGETMHFEYICEAVTHGLMRVQLDRDVPVVFGVLTLLSEEQGLARAGVGDGAHNHGLDWGSVAVELGVKRRAWARGEFLL